MEDKLQLLTKKQKLLKSLPPLSKDQLENLEEWFKVELTYSSNAIEGNTLTRIETAEVIEKGVSAVISGKPLKDQLEAINHAKALDFIKELAKQRKSHQFITEDDIKAIQKIILTGIHDDWAGVYRKIEIYVRGSNTDFPLPNQVPSLMKNFAHWLEGQQEEHPVRVAADAHFKLASIHGFRDGNGRTARLLMNVILLIHGYPMAIIRNEQREEYLALFDMVRSTNDMQPFYNFIDEAVERSLDAYINAAQGKSIFDALRKNTGNEKQEVLWVGDLAKKTGVSEHTIRYWTEEGLLTIKNTTAGNYRVYDASMVDVVKEILRLKKELRLTLPEIKDKLKKFGVSISG